MDIALIEQLYSVANDESAEIRDRDDARNYLLEHEAEIVAAFLVLPEMPKPKDGNPMFPTYETVYSRNCLDRKHVWSAELGRMKSDPTSIPLESDKIGNCLFRRRVAIRALDEKF